MKEECLEARVMKTKLVQDNRNWLELAHNNVNRHLHADYKKIVLNGQSRRRKVFPYNFFTYVLSVMKVSGNYVVEVF
jgi:hypothetical protein